MGLLDAPGVSKATADQAYAPALYTSALPEPDGLRSIATVYLPGTTSTTATLIRFGDTSRQKLIIRNLSKTQSLNIGYGGVGNNITLPSTYPDVVPPGGSWTLDSGDQRVIAAYFPTSAEPVEVETWVGVIP